MKYTTIVNDLPCELDFYETYIKTNSFLHTTISDYASDIHCDVLNLKFPIKYYLPNNKSNFESSIILDEMSKYLFNKEYISLAETDQNTCDQIIRNVEYYMGVHKTVYNPFANKIFTDTNDKESTDIKNAEIDEINQIVTLIRYYKEKANHTTKIKYGSNDDYSINFRSSKIYRSYIYFMLKDLISLHLENTSYKYIAVSDGILLVKRNDKFIERDIDMDYMFTFYCKQNINNSILREFEINPNLVLQDDHLSNFDFAGIYFPILLKSMKEFKGDGKTSKLKLEIKKWILPMVGYLHSFRVKHKSFQTQSKASLQRLLFHFLISFDFIPQNNKIVKIYFEDPFDIKISRYMRYIIS